MSLQILAKSVATVRASSVANSIYVKSTQAGHCFVSHCQPAVATKLCRSGSSLAFRIRHTNDASQMERMTTNLSKIYARRILEALAVSTAAWHATSKKESLAEQQMSVPMKPTEWATVDLLEQRKQILDSISTLGKTKLERVLSAGMYYVCMYVCTLLP